MRLPAATTALLLGALLLLPAALAWTTTEVDREGWASADLAIGDGDRDGAKEVYWTDGHDLHEYSWDAAAQDWSRTLVADDLAAAVALGDGDRDGQREVYVGRHQQLHQCVRNATAWDCRPIMTWTGEHFIAVRAITVGDAEHDGLLEVYINAEVRYGPAYEAEGETYKVWYSGGQWHDKRLTSPYGHPAHGLWIGDGDRDGKRELYASGEGGQVWRIKLVEGWWRLTHLGSVPGTSQGVAVGDPNHDGKADVVAVGSEGQLARFAWTGNGWVKVVLRQFQSGLWDVTLGDVDGDGKEEVYVASDAPGGRTYQVRWTGSAWAVQDLGGVAGASLGQDVAVGDGDDDGGLEVYAGLVKECCPQGVLAEHEP
jgi:hypothetical protein